jgi:acyl transferase domain-containing protein/NAD(P)H-dependent flavin oxidoreductase YrpB (nitropropane dioxygenase family)
VFGLSPAIIGITPFGLPDVQLAVALATAGGIGVVDLGLDADASRRALADLERRPLERIGVHLNTNIGLEPAEIPSEIAVIVLDGDADLSRWVDHAVLVQAVSIAEAKAAVHAGAAGVILKGSESGGRIGDEGAFVLAQQGHTLGVPFFVQGGIGPRTTAACLAAGAQGVVLDSQLALLRESSLGTELRAFTSRMDGSETEIVDGRRGCFAAGGTQDVSDSSNGTAGSFVPLGQDASLAAGIARQFKTAHRLVAALRADSRDSIRTASRRRVLVEKSPLARQLATRLPIAQGPMTRVSDVSGFAERVADGGALPFIALALMRGDDVRRLLEETAARLGDVPWGVGVLGFVPPELRDEQMAVVTDIKPSVALIAGGRPAQAQPLEAEGITTFLHVPSPTLLEQFLRQGARNFVFEGRECGGHVGPRTSFNLWEQQLDVLARAEVADDVSVLLAGGVHDSRSAAMVEALAASLVDRRIHVGVLMGTAYLFTEEAVSSGAITPTFQQSAINSEQTVLLETAPGHATRCAATPYATTFTEEKAQMQREGVEPAEQWERLERMNLGKLRVASKGLRRDGDELVAVDEIEQRDEGMVMIGEVAALRDELTTVDALHAEISVGAGDVLAQLGATSVDGPPSSKPADVAIVGMAGIFPGAPDLEAFWANIVRGVDSVTDVPERRWDADVFYDPDGEAGETTPAKWGGFVDPIPFEPMDFGIPPLSLAAIEPAQLVALEVSRRALDDAGLASRNFNRERASVIFGAESGSDLSAGNSFRALWRQYVGEMPEELDRALPNLTEDSFPGMLANVIAGRIANRLDLGGVNYTVDAACASSLAAIDLAIKELTLGTSDTVVCGAVDLHNGLNDYLAFSAVRALSRTGKCRTFDANADGIVLGEGVAAVVLKRLSDAERDGDRVYAVIKGVGGSSDGKSLGLTAPRRAGQIRALDRAYAQAGFPPADVQLVEAHGTGTVVGDRTELETLDDVFSIGADRAATCSLGSVKSQIGHTKCAAGLAGLIKTALALERRVLPPTVNIDEPNPAWNSETSPFTLSDASRPWLSADRKAAVSAFGFGGTNFHVVLEEHDSPERFTSIDRWPAELFLFRGESEEAAHAEVSKLSDALARERGWRLRDLARTVSLGSFPVQFAVVARDLDELDASLASLASREPDSKNSMRRGLSADGAPSVAFLFPGQGSQRVGMLRDLFVGFPSLHRFADMGPSWAAAMLPPTAWTEDERQAQTKSLTDTRTAQPALGIAGLAMAELLGQFGISPTMAAGHSYGELVALCISGAIDESDLLALSAARGESMVEVIEGADGDAGGMAAVSGSRDQVVGAIEGVSGVVVANDNAPDQIVLSGPSSSIDEALVELERAGISARRLPVACAFHSPVVASAADVFRGVLGEHDVREPSFPVFANATAAQYPTNPDEIRELLARQLAEPVRFVEQVEAMYVAGARVFVEAGPGCVLSGLVTRILGDRDHVVVPCDQAGEDGIEQFLRALGTISVNGGQLEAAKLFEGRDAEIVDLSSTSGREPSENAWMVDGRNARPLHGEAPSHALADVNGPIVDGNRIGVPAGDDETVVLEYLGSLRDIVSAQRDVVMGYLGTDEPREPRTRRAEPAVSSGSAATNGASEPLEPASTGNDTDPKTVLLAIVSERTGYPEEMLDLDLDLEADLSIDSIKRVEILGALDERLGGTGHSDVPEELVAVKTLRGIIEVMERASDHGAAPQIEPTPDLEQGASNGVSSDSNGAAVPVEAAMLDIPVRRYLVQFQGDATTEADRAASERPLAQQQLVVVADGTGIAECLVELLSELGVDAEVISSQAGVGELDTLVDLSLLRADATAADVKTLFDRTRAAVLGGATQLLIATGVGIANGLGQANGLGRANGRGTVAGVAGLLKSIRKERSDIVVRAVDVDDSDEPSRIARHVLDELRSTSDGVEVAYSSGARSVPSLIEASHALNGATLELGESDVILTTGGARGITARIIVEIASRFGCKLEIIGRTPLEGAEEHVELAGAHTAPEIRRLLAKQGALVRPAEIERECSRILAGRAIRATLQSVADVGGQARYHAVDVRDEARFEEVVGEIYARQGKIDGVIHGAGVIEDRLIADKTRESFERVFDTKVVGALVLARALRDDVRFMGFFSSIAGAFGNKGQTDYAAANDFLDKLAAVLNSQRSGRVFSINWGPWRDGGMVSPELEREMAQRGIGLISPEEGVESFMNELLRGSGDDQQVVIMKADPTALA